MPNGPRCEQHGPFDCAVASALVALASLTGLEAVAAINGLVAARLERNARLAAALRAARREHLARCASAATGGAAATTTRRFASGAAIRTGVGLVGEAFLRKK